MVCIHQDLAGVARLAGRISFGILIVALAPPTLLLSQSGTQVTLEAKTRLDAEVVHLTPYGFIPAKITRPPGRFLLVVRNMIGRPELELRRTGANTAALKSYKATGPQSERNWRVDVELPPGEYNVQDPSNSKLALTISVAAK